MSKRIEQISRGVTLRLFDFIPLRLWLNAADGNTRKSRDESFPEGNGSIVERAISMFARFRPFHPFPFATGPARLGGKVFWNGAVGLF